MATIDHDGTIVESQQGVALDRACRVIVCSSMMLNSSTTGGAGLFLRAMEQRSNYYDRINEQLVALALKYGVGGRVLDLGCGKGVLGRRLLQAGARWVGGVERHAAASREARSALSEVFEGDLETLALPLEPGVLDLIVCGDVLEHLVDPWTALAKYAQLLKPAGRIIASVPNVNHSMLFAQLLQGKFEYGESGLLDRTHLRFFTLDGVVRLFAHAQMKIVTSTSVQVTRPALEALAVDLEAVARKYGLANDRLKVDLATFQWLVDARKEDG